MRNFPKLSAEREALEAVENDMQANRTLEPDEQKLLELVLSNLKRAQETSASCLIAASAGRMPERGMLEKLEHEIRASNSPLIALIERAKGCPPPVKG